MSDSSPLTRVYTQSRISSHEEVAVEVKATPPNTPTQPAPVPTMAPVSEVKKVEEVKEVKKIEEVKESKEPKEQKITEKKGRKKKHVEEDDDDDKKNSSDVELNDKKTKESDDSSEETEDKDADSDEEGEVKKPKKKKPVTGDEKGCCDGCCDNCCCYGNGCCACDEEGYCGPKEHTNSGHGPINCKCGWICTLNYASIISFACGIILVGIYFSAAIATVRNADEFCTYVKQLQIEPAYVTIALLISGSTVQAVLSFIKIIAHRSSMESNKLYSNALIKDINIQLQKLPYIQELFTTKEIPNYQFTREKKFNIWNRLNVALVIIAICGIASMFVGAFLMVNNTLAAMFVLVLGSFMLFGSALIARYFLSQANKDRKQATQEFRSLAILLGIDVSGVDSTYADAYDDIRDELHKVPTSYQVVRMIRNNYRNNNLAVPLIPGVIAKI